jgi:hypothetical protein
MDDHAQLKTLLTALDASPVALRREMVDRPARPIGDWAIIGKSGHVLSRRCRLAGFLLYVTTAGKPAQPRPSPGSAAAGQPPSGLPRTAISDPTRGRQAGRDKVGKNIISVDAPPCQGQLNRIMALVVAAAVEVAAAAAWEVGRS